MSQKTCRDCGVEKPPDQFHTHPQMRDGRHNYCVECYRRHNRERYHRRKGGDLRDNRRTRPLQSDGFRECPDCGELKPASEFAVRRRTADGLHTYCRSCNSARSIASAMRIHGSVRAAMLKTRYGVTAEQVDAMIEGQRGLCAICWSKHAEHVDHDHATGAIRGMLCFTCNVGLGNFADDVDRIADAVLYLGGRLRPPEVGVAAELPSGEPRLAATGRSAIALWHLKKKYGLTERELAAMMAAQGGRCVICLAGPAEHVDHDHTTGAVRGILCSGCNTGLGNFGDDLFRLIGAMNYLTVLESCDES